MDDDSRNTSNAYHVAATPINNTNKPAIIPQSRNTFGNDNIPAPTALAANDTTEPRYFIGQASAMNI
jgi:hypothetical protein